MNQKRDLNNISRRRFGQTGVAAMLAAGAAPAFIGRALADEPKKQLGLAIVGLGGYATNSIAPELDSLGVELVKLEVVGGSRNPVVRLYIDKPGGVAISDCTLVSRTISMLLDEADPIPRRYLLEVR